MKNNYQLKKYQPLSLRLWHWGTALVIIGLLLTVLLRKTFLSWRSNSKLIESRIVEAGGSVTTDVAVSIAKELRNIMWDWHIYLGFALGALIIYRLILTFTTVKNDSIVKILKSQTKAQGLPKAEQNQVRYFAAVRGVYALFYIATTFMVVSGIVLYFEKELSLAKDLKGFLKETHELTMWFFVGFLVVHILGVVFAETRKATKGIVSNMINGGDKN